MMDYRFVTVWKLRAPIDRVWQAIWESEKWPEWWQGVISVQTLRPNGASGVGGLLYYVWRSKLPYNLAFNMELVTCTPPRLLAGNATGELEGSGVWELDEEDGVTTVRYTWAVHTTRAWMNLLAPVARPLFAWNHDFVMANGAKGLAKLLNAELIANLHSTG